MTEKEPEQIENKRDLGSLADWWQATRVAGSFLTRLPWPVDEDEAATPIGTVAATFPVVGILVGAIAAVVLMMATWSGLSPLATALLAIGATVIVSGGLHEDGLADVADGFGGGVTKEDKLRIMKDSRIGAFGVLAVVFAVGLRVTLIGGMDPWLAAAALIGAGAASRAALPVLMTVLEPARDKGLGARSGKPAWNDVVGGLIYAGVALLLCGYAGVLGAFAGVCAAYAMIRLAQRHIGGQTGDVLGATQVVVETAVYLGVAISS